MIFSPHPDVRYHPTSSFVRVIMGVGFGATLAASRRLEHRQLSA
jgi:hypothetical protein